MAMVASRKLKCCVFWLLVLVSSGICLAVLSTLGFFDAKTEHIEVGTAEKYQWKPGLPSANGGAFQELKLYGSPSQAEIQCVNTFEEIARGSDGDEIDIDNLLVDQEEGDGEGSGRYGSIPPFPPPPPGLDGYPLRLRGEKGDRGPRGPPGESIRGPPGPPGPPGPVAVAVTATTEISGSGDSQIFGENYTAAGQCGCNATTILALLQTLPDLKGPPGPPGVTGADGRSGPPGLPGQTGLPGDRGPIGPRGEKGDRGDIGARGLEGQPGSKGEAGVDGRIGSPGPAGPPGPPGPGDYNNFDESLMGAYGGAIGRPGAPGPKGDVGQPGPSGPQGDRGFPGQKGERGQSGVAGVKGDRGYPGPYGERGVKGDRGPPGLDGRPGLPGVNGRPAEKGERGEPGPPGPTAFAKFNVENQEVLSYGNQEVAVSKGEKGEKGERGSYGADGLPGVSGKDGKTGDRGDIGPSGMPGMVGPPGVPGLKGERGERGPPGPISVTATGSDIITIKGDKGDPGLRGRRGRPGPTGPRGLQGLQGTPGSPGKPGEKGDIGLPGWMGRPGSLGPPGVPGSVGLKGEKGEPGVNILDVSMFKGEKGDRGINGIPGLAGPEGPPGRPGPPGSLSDAVQYLPGPPGPPGPPGTPGISIVGPKGEPGLSHYEDHPVHGNTKFYARPVAKSRLDELKALKELKDLKDHKHGPSSPGFGARGRLSEDSTRDQSAPGSSVFQTTEEMMKLTSSSPVGALAYVVEEQALFVKVNSGWQYVLLGSLVTQTVPSSTPLPAPPLPAASLVHVPPISNLVENSPALQTGPSLRIAALNDPLSGNMHGVRRADYACYRQARRAGLRGTFRAFLTSRIQNLVSTVRYADRHLPVVNIQGDLLFKSFSDIFDGSGGLLVNTPRIYSFNGKNIITESHWPQKMIWHGSHASGERALDTFCEEWQSSDPTNRGMAASLYSRRLLSQERYSCNNHFAVLCIEATSNVSVRRKRDISKYNSTGFLDDEDYLYSPEDYQQLLTEIFAQPFREN